MPLPTAFPNFNREDQVIQVVKPATGPPRPRPEFDPFGIADACSRVLMAWLQRPDLLDEGLARLARELRTESLQAWLRWWGIPANDVVPPVKYDQRFQDPAWVVYPGLDHLKQVYLLHTRWLQDAIYATPDVDEGQRRRAAFWVRQWQDAIAPSNVFWTNPEAISQALKTGGSSLYRGFRNWLRDLAAGDIAMVAPDAFMVGKDLATTPGRVVLRNELVEVIQYAPVTPQVHAIPVVLIAPWINKYYILDLGPDNSLVRYLVDRGYTVFVTSWKNPGPELRNTTWEDYLFKGALTAIEAARDICQSAQVHAAGYCLGGTTLAALLAWLNADSTPSDACPVAHWTLFTTLVDFSEPGEIGVFIDEPSCAFLERRMARTGYLDGADMARTFRMLRPNSLIWHYVIRSYLYGEALPNSDVLYWNMDTTRMPAAMHCCYLRELYLNNRLAVPGGLVLGGRPLDLGAIRQPLYTVGAEQDHITPWRQTFRTCSLVSGPVRYVLATSGHILGVINPPTSPPRRRYWVNDASGQTDPDAWLQAIATCPGSWWDDWSAWLAPRCGPLQDPPPLGNERFPALAEAPGSYVREI